MSMETSQPGPSHPPSLRALLAAALAGVTLSAGIFFASTHWRPKPTELERQVHELSAELKQLQQEQQMPTTVLNRYRNSICYIFGVYRVSMPHNETKPALRARVAGTGFVVAEGLLATNRHVAEPWFGDPEAEELIREGGTPQLEKLLAFFPNMPQPVQISPVVVSPVHDLAVVRLAEGERAKLEPLPLADQIEAPGGLVAVVGYPMGVAGMVAKSPSPVYERLASRRDDAGAASELAALSLIRPSATYGHLGDVVGSKLVYDAPTAHGGSGGPVFDLHGQVIGVNTAYMDGFTGGTLGISVGALKPLVAVAQQHEGN
jgi:S1-C subfamily serine protease